MCITEAMGKNTKTRHEHLTSSSFNVMKQPRLELVQIYDNGFARSHPTETFCGTMNIISSDNSNLASIVPITSSAEQSEDEVPDAKPSSNDEYSESTLQASQNEKVSTNILEEGKTRTRRESRIELATPILREQSNEPSSSGSFAIGDMLWVTQGKTEHMAIFVDESSHYRNDEILVRWGANNLTEYVPISSVKPLGDERQKRRQTQERERQHGQYEETKVVGRKRKRAESTAGGNSGIAAVTCGHQIPKTTAKSSQSSSSSNGHQHQDWEECLVYEMDVVSVAIINRILQEGTVKSRRYQKVSREPSQRRVRIRENDIFVGLHRIKGHKGDDLFKTIINLFKNNKFERRTMSFRRILVIASELSDFIHHKLGGRFLRKRDNKKHEEKIIHKWIILSRDDATRIIRQALCHSIGVKNGIVKRRKRRKLHLHGAAREIFQQEERNESSPEMAIGSQNSCGEISSPDMQHTETIKSREKTETDLVPTSLDVICGEISPLEMPNDGNCWLRSQVSSMTETYHASTSGAEKTAIARRLLVGVWRSGGRFLVQTKTGGWREMERTDSLIEIRMAFLQQKQNSTSEVRLV